MKRSLWTQSFSENHALPWPCPACAKGTLAMVPKSLVHKETAESRDAHGHEAWDPDWIAYVFTTWLKCNHATCGQEVAVAGVGGMEPWYDNDEGGMGWAAYFSPKWCSPMPNIFELPAKCPDKIKEELTAGFSLFFSDKAATANRIRIALECLMDHLGVQRRQKQGGKFLEMSLHQRIKVFEQGEPTIGAQLMAIKWLGNTGSHEGQVSRDDILDAFEILEHALGELIDRRSAKVAQLARQLTKKHQRKKGF